MPWEAPRYIPESCYTFASFAIDLPVFWGGKKFGAAAEVWRWSRSLALEQKFGAGALFGAGAVVLISTYKLTYNIGHML